MPEGTVLAAISHAMSDADLESDVAEDDDISFEDSSDSSESKEAEPSDSDS